MGISVTDRVAPVEIQPPTPRPRPMMPGPSVGLEGPGPDPAAFTNAVLDNPPKPTPRPGGLDGEEELDIPELSGEPTEDDGALWHGISAAMNANVQTDNPLAAGIMGFIEAKRAIKDYKTAAEERARERAMEDEDRQWKREDRDIARSDRERRFSREDEQDARAARREARDDQMFDYDLLAKGVAIDAALEKARSGSLSATDMKNLADGEKAELSTIDDDGSLTPEERLELRRQIRERYARARGEARAINDAAKAATPAPEEEAALEPPPNSYIGSEIGDMSAMEGDPAPAPEPARPDVLGSSKPAQAGGITGGGTDVDPFEGVPDDEASATDFERRLKPGQYFRWRGTLYIKE